MMETEKTNVVVWPKGFKKTKQREQVLSILENADVPVTAMDIYTRKRKALLSGCLLFTGSWTSLPRKSW